MKTVHFIMPDYDRKPGLVHRLDEDDAVESLGWQAAGVLVMLAAAALVCWVAIEVTRWVGALMVAGRLMP